MKVDAVTLSLLLESMSEGVREINALLREPVSRSSVRAMARVAHKLKGEATVVGIKNLSKLIVALEDSLECLLPFDRIEPSQLKAITLFLKKIVRACRHINKVAVESKLQLRKQRLACVRQNGASGALTTTLKVLAANVSKACGKQVSLNLAKFNSGHVPAEYRAKVQDIIIQLVRNAIVHGVEPPAERLKNSKPQFGTVSVYTKLTNGSVYVVVHDDGRGIDLDEVRKRLVINYNFTVLQVAKMSRAELLDSLFLPGFSTHTEKHQHAGRGVGLDLVKAYSKGVDGEVAVRFEVNRFAQFIVRIPLAAKKNVTPFRHLDIDQSLRATPIKASKNYRKKTPSFVGIA